MTMLLVAGGAVLLLAVFAALHRANDRALQNLIDAPTSRRYDYIAAGQEVLPPERGLQPWQPPPAAPTSLSTWKPVARPSLESDVGVPVLQALASATIAALVALVGCWLASAPLRSAGRWGVGAFVFVLAASWLARLHFVDSLLSAVDSLEGQLVGDERPAAHIISLNPHQGRQAQERDAAAETKALFAAFVRGCAADTSSRRWEKALGRDLYQEWRDLLIGAGYARWKGRDNKGGWELTAEPATVLQAIDAP